MKDKKSFEEHSDSIEIRDFTPEEQKEFDDFNERMQQDIERRRAEEAQKDHVSEDDFVNQFVSLAEKGDVVDAIREIAKELYKLHYCKPDLKKILGGY